MIEWLVEAGKGRERREYTVTAATRDAALTAARRRAPKGWRIVNLKSKRHLGIGRSTGKR